MTTGSIIEVGGLLHRVWNFRDRFGDTLTFCGMRTRHVLETHTPPVTCVACLVHVANYPASSAG